LSLILTANATIMCVHGGTVAPEPQQTSVIIEGGPVLCEGDLVGAAIIGCPQAGPGIKPCTSVIATLPESVSPMVSAGGRAVHLDTLDGQTDGNPPGTLIVIDPGQTTVNA
jgi:hypothetical protein